MGRRQILDQILNKLRGQGAQLAGVEDQLSNQDLERPIGSVLLTLGVPRDAVSDALADHYHVPFLDLSTFQLDQSLAGLIPNEVARTLKIVPLFRTGDSLMLACADPFDDLALQDLEAQLKMRLELCLAFEEDIVPALTRLYGASSNIQSDIDQTLNKGGARRSGDAPAVRILDLILEDAIARGASDVHMEPEKDGVKVRLRVDGVLEPGASLPRDLHAPLVARLKVLAELDLSESRRPQDGHLHHASDSGDVDLRLSIIPTVLGENVVLRVVPLNRKIGDLGQLGLAEAEVKRFQQSLKSPHGLILVTGPTGSGKTTTLYAALQMVRSPTRHIVTIEDPVESLIPGVRQIQVSPRAGLDFADGLRAILRHDPDVIMVGEIRDAKSAVVALQASLTGHLVLASLHTNDAASAVARLLDLGVEPFLVSASLRAVIAQRLVKKLCVACREPHAPPEATLAQLGIAEAAHVFRPRGCDLCRFTGYRGRVGVFEVLIVDDAISEGIVGQPSPEQLRVLAQATGMRTIAEDAAHKLRQGVTSIEEVLGVTLLTHAS
ncbi:MAG: GspE/PulE family protein [Planctomycetota bacterium]